MRLKHAPTVKKEVSSKPNILLSPPQSLTNPGGYGGACWICPLRVMLMNSLISQVISVAWWVCARYSVSHR